MSTEEEQQEIIQKIVTAEGKSTGTFSNYFVKFEGKSYGKCQWISEKDLLKAPNHRSLLQAFNKILHYPKNPPFYNPRYDIIERIICTQDGKYLVKWCDLDYTQLSLEDSVPDEVALLYEKRLELKYPNTNTSTEKHILEVTPNPDLSLLGNICFMNISYMYSFENECSINDNFSFDVKRPIILLFEKLFEAYPETGPFLIITASSGLSQWIDILIQNPNLSTVVYDGSEANRSKIKEIDFFGEDNKYKFHVLLTTPDTINTDTFLTSLRFDIIVNCQCTYKAPPKHNFLISLSCDEKLVSDMILELSNFCLSLQEIIQSEDLISIMNHKQKLQVVASKIIEKSQPSIHYTYIDCPLTPVQKEVIRSLILRFDPSDGYRRLLDQFYRCSQHPFLLFGMENELCGEDFYKISTKLQVFMTLFRDQMSNNQRVILVSQYDQILDLVEDLMTKEDYLCSRITKPTGDYDNDPASLFLYNPLSCPLYFTTLDYINCAIIFDINSKYFIEQVTTKRSIISKFRNIIYLQCNETCEPLITDLNNEEMLCKIIALHSFSPKVIPSIESLIINSTEEPMNNISQEDLNTISIFNNENNENNFWNLLKESIKEHKREPKLNKEQWTLRERDQLFRYLFRFSWDRWDDIMKYGGIFREKNDVINASRSLVKEMLQGLDESFVLIKDMVRESNNEDADNYRQFMNQSVFAKSNFHDLIHDKSYELLQRLEVLHYIERAMSLSGNNMDKLQIGRIVGKKPSENWNEEYDKLLVIAAYKYGFGVYDFLSEDKDKRFMELFMNGKIQHQMLNERLLKIGESLKRINVSFIQKVDDSYPSEDENFEFDEEFDDDNQFSRSEKSRIFKYLVRFGIDNYEKMRNDIGLNSKPLENLKEYVEAFMQKCENGTMPHVTAVRVKTRVESMNRLRSILQLGIEFFKRAPRWRQLPQSWNSSIEFSFFQEIKNRGITAMNEIAQLDTFKTIDFPAFIFKTKSIMLRIKSLYEFSQKNWVSSKPSKPRPPVTENPSQKDAHLIAKVLNGDVKYPFKISSSSYILDIGTIVTDRPLFHTQTYIYPAGYKSTRLFSSLDDPTERVTYLSEIIDNGTETPRFRVTQEGTDHVFEGDTPTAPWAKILKKFTEKNAKKGKSISGPDAFLLKSPVTISLIQQQPGIEELENYQMKKYNLNPSHNKKKKSRAKVFEYELSDETSTSSSESEEEAENEK